jgi:hypothetical protein
MFFMTRRSPSFFRLAPAAAGILVFLFAAASAEAVMPPGHYARMAEASKIKAIAVVKSVQVIERTKLSTHKRVVFDLKHPFNEAVPETFSGTCYSVDHAWQEPGAGGTIYHYPSAGAAVYVTVASDGGSITSYTVLNEAAEEQFLQNPGRIRYGMGKAYLEK